MYISLCFPSNLPFLTSAKGPSLRDNVLVIGSGLVAAMLKIMGCFLRGFLVNTPCLRFWVCCSSTERPFKLGG